MKSGTTVTALFLFSLLPRLGLSVFVAERSIPENLLDLVWIRNLVNCDYKYGRESQMLVSVGMLHFPSGVAPDIPKS